MAGWQRSDTSNRDRVVAPVVCFAQAGELVEAGTAVDGEAFHLVAERGAMSDVVLGGEAVGELGQHLGELGMDGSAVVAHHEVLHDELPACSAAKIPGSA
jgi:hypothetical protein